jgi:hypothetical protein
VDMAADGNCLFRSLADQLFGDHGDAHDGVRDEICDYLAGHEAAFAFFLDLDDETTAGDDASTYDAYVEQMRQDGEWGGHLELVAAARLYRRTVTIYSSSLASLNIDHGASQAAAGPPLLVSYHDNDHYNSIRETGRASPPPLPIRTYIKEDNDGAMEVATKLTTKEGIDEATAETDTERDSTEAVEVPAAEEVPEAGAAGPTTTKKKQKKAKPGGLCPCGSGEKYRKCCKEKDKRAAHQERVKVQKTLKEETESTTGQAEVAMDGDFRKLTI